MENDWTVWTSRIAARSPVPPRESPPAAPFRLANYLAQTVPPRESPRFLHFVPPIGDLAVPSALCYNA